jgi:hypothetical protein
MLKVTNVVEGGILTKPEEKEKKLTWAQVASASTVDHSRTNRS